MLQAQFLIPASLIKDAVTIDASSTAQDVVLTYEATQVRATPVEDGTCSIRINGTCSETDGEWDVYVVSPDTGFTVPKGTTLSVVGDGTIKLTSF